VKFYIHKLGCPKNDVDADYIAARLLRDGHEPVFSPEAADSIIVNTCGFILPAREESINEILALGQLKKDGGVKSLFVAGCLAQRYGDDLLEGMPEIDGAFGLGELDAIAEAMNSGADRSRTIRTEPRKLGYLDFNSRFIADNLPYAYLKISDGCDRHCSYSAIPSIRGRFRSRPLESIMREAQYLAENGKKELILVSQDATAYGRCYPDENQPDIITLLKALEEVKGVEWIRLMYLYAADVTGELIEYMTGDNKTLPYFDLPLQHVNSDILRAMKRQIDTAAIERLIGRIREQSAEAAIRTTFIVGFPGETEDQYDELEQFVLRHEFDRMGAFVYSSEEGTKAGSMPNSLSETEKNERLDRLMSAQREIAYDRNISLLGEIRDVIIDRISEDGPATGRTFADCPDIDQEVYVTGERLEVGEISRVRIESADGYDLVGTVIED